MNRKLTIVMAVLFTAISYLGKAQEKANGSEVLLQGFHWESAGPAKNWWSILQSQANEIGSARFDAVWLPPSSDAGDRAGYLPRKWYNLNSNYGSKDQLKSLVSTLNGKGVKSIADIVINHRVGTNGWADFTEPSLGCWAICGDDEVNAHQSGAACGDNDTGTQYPDARDLNHKNQGVRDAIIAWMNWLKSEVGYAGWRYDYVHGFSAEYFATYNNSTNPYISIGEDWTGDAQSIINWIDGTSGTSSAFDFALKYKLHEAVNGNYGALARNGGKLPGVMGIWPQKAITFLENHDTEPVRGNPNNIFPNNPNTNSQILQGYAYILTHPGTPMVFYSHYFSYGIKDKIKEMIAIRKENHLNHDSKVDIKFADGSGYAAIIDGKVAMKIGGSMWSPGNNWKLKASGPNYAIWDLGSVNPVPEVSITPSQSNHSNGSVNVCISATNGGGIYYTLDGSTPSSHSNKYTGCFTLFGKETETKEVKAIAYNEAGASTIVSQKYTFRSQATMTLHWKTSCGTPKIYFWGLVGGTDTTTWPGETMTDNDGDGWYDYTLEAECTNVIFSCNGANKTIDLLNVCGDAWYNNGWITVKDEIAPQIDITPKGGTFEGSVSVTISATDNKDTNPTIYYTLNGDTPSESSKSASKSVTLTINNSTTIKAFAKDNSSNKSGTISESYTIKPKEGGFTVHVQGYNNAMIHHWNAKPTGSFRDSNWPGKAMGDNDNDGWYDFTFPSNVTSSNLLFHDNNGNKSIDLYRDKDGWYKDGKWYDTKPGNSPSGLTVHFYLPDSWGSGPVKIHYWNATPSSIPNTNWPGVNMTSEGGRWYKYTITGASAAHLLFHNGNGAKTPDLEASSEMWYKDGSWHGSQPLRVAGLDPSIGELNGKLSLEVFPNPTDGISRIQFETPEAGHTSLRIYDALGKEIKTLYNDKATAGAHSVEFDSSTLGSGLFILKLKSKNQSQSQRLIVK